MNLSEMLITAFGPSGGGGRTGAMDLNRNPEAAGIMPEATVGGKPPKDVWDRLGAQLDFANQVATVGRGMYSDLSKGPGGSPLMARPAGTPFAYKPTAGMGSMRLSDLLARR